MARFLRLLLALPCGVSAPAAAATPWVPPPGFEVFDYAEVLGPAPFVPEAARRPGAALSTRPVLLAGGATLGGDAAEDAFRNRYGLDRHAPLLLSYWLRYGANGAREVIGEAYCAQRLKVGTGAVLDCFRDSNGDGRLDEALSYAPAKRQSAALAFSRIPPVPFTPWVAPAAPDRGWGAARGYARLEYAWDAAAARLVFYVLSREAFGRAEERLEPSVSIDPARLPATLVLAGSQLRLLRWDGKQLTLSIEAVMKPTRVRVDPPAVPGRKKGGYRLEVVPATAADGGPPR